jgi:hypothetical protein
MKKLFTSIFSLSVISVVAQFQTPFKNPAERNRVSEAEVLQLKSQHSGYQRDVVSVYVNYPISDVYEQGLSISNDPNNPTVRNYLWSFNSNYTTADTNDIIPINYAAVRLFDLAGYTDPADPLEDPLETYTGILAYPSNLTVTIDTIFVLFSHENNSGLEDSIMLELRELDANNNILPNNSLVWSDTLVTNSSLSPGGSWVGPGALAFLSLPCGHQTLEDQKIGLNFRYIAPKQDTMGLLASYSINPNGPLTPPNDKALKTKFPHNYFRWMGILNDGIYNTSGITYGNPPSGEDTAFFKIQNWQMWFAVTFEDVTTATQEKMILPLGLDQNYPNPFEFSSSFSFTIQESQDLTLQITDVNGRIIANKELGHHLTGSYSAPLPSENLSAGAYFYQLIGENDKSAVRRFIVSK